MHGQSPRSDTRDGVYEGLPHYDHGTEENNDSVIVSIPAYETGGQDSHDRITSHNGHPDEDNDDASTIHDCYDANIELIMNTTMVLPKQPLPRFCEPAGVEDIVMRSGCYRTLLSFWPARMRKTDFLGSLWDGEPVSYLAEEWEVAADDEEEVLVTWSPMWVRDIPIAGWEDATTRLDDLVQENEKLRGCNSTSLCYIYDRGPMRRVFHLCLPAVCEDCELRMELEKRRKDAATHLHENGVPKDIIARILTQAHTDNPVSGYFHAVYDSRRS